MVSQLKQADMLDRYQEVLQEVPKVRADLGYPPLVTPTSQIVGTQAVFNVMMGRYAQCTKETKALVKGEYGRASVPISDEIKHLIIGDEPTIDCRPADLIEPQMAKFRDEVKDYIQQEEDVSHMPSSPRLPSILQVAEGTARKQVDRPFLHLEVPGFRKKAPSVFRAYSSTVVFSFAPTCTEHQCRTMPKDLIRRAVSIA